MCWFLSFCWCHNICNSYHRLTFMTPGWRKSLQQKPCALNHVLCRLDVGVTNLWRWFWSHKILWHLILSHNCLHHARLIMGQAHCCSSFLAWPISYFNPFSTYFSIIFILANPAHVNGLAHIFYALFRLSPCKIYLGQSTQILVRPAYATFFRAYFY